MIIQSASSVTYLFAKANMNYTVSLETKIADKVIGTSISVTTGQPLAYTVTADTATNIGSDWSRVWSIDGNVVEGASTAKLTHLLNRS